MQWAPAWASVSDPSWLRFGRAGSAVFLALGCIVILAWQLQIMGRPGQIDRTWRATPGERGLYEKLGQVPFYFYYYTGKFPIFYNGPRRDLKEDPETAAALLRPRDRSPLSNEKIVYVRKGDLAQVFLLFPDVWRHGSPRHATARTANQLLAVISLLALFVSFGLLQHRLLGSVLVLLLGSHPYAILHYYVFKDVWAYSIGVGALMLALCAPLLFARRASRLHLAIPVVAGVFLASVREVRTEPAVIGASVAIACAFAPGGWRRKTALLALLVGGFGVTSSAWASYWSEKRQEAYEIVKAAGGRPYLGLANTHHTVWHSIWCGLGDFGGEKGYGWRDRIAHAYAVPVLNERYGMELEFSPRNKLWLKNKDEYGYALKLETLPEYDEVLQSKIAEDVLSDPLWFANVLWKRFVRILSRPPPARIGWGASWVDLPFTAWLALPLFAFTIAMRRWDQAQLLLFLTPTSLPALLVHSSRGTLNVTTFHLATLAVLVCWLVHLGTRFLEARRVVSASRASAPG